jgi:ABC-type transport system involved in multi-copper enzyme maturation permease subunit
MVRLNLGLGPVFKFECLSASRRWQYFAGRVVFVGILLGALGIVVWNVEAGARTPTGLRASANAGEKFYLAFITTQLSLLFLIAPAITADAICLDKARGALLPLLTTDLSSREIILGKLFARFLPILGFVFCGLPVLAICFSMGGIHPEVVFGAFLVSLGVALVGGAAALLLSVWCTKTYEVLLVCYLLWIGFLLLLPSGWVFPAGTPLAWAEYSNPYYLCLAPYMSPGSVDIPEFIYFFVGCAAFSVFLVIIAIWSLRGVVVRHGSVVSKTRPTRMNRWSRRFRIPWLPRPSLDGNPVLWREWHRRLPSRWVRAVWSLYGLVAFGFSLYVFCHVLLQSHSRQRELGAFVNAFGVSVGLLLVSVTSVTSLQEERLRGSMDVLLTTPLSTLQVFWGKWWGSFRLVLRLAVLPTALSFAPILAVFLGRARAEGAPFHNIAGSFLLMPVVICCYGAAVVSLGLALAIWIKGPGKAMAASVILYLLPTVGCLLSPLFFHSGEDFKTLGSSFMAMGYLTIIGLEPVPIGVLSVIPWLMVWSIVYAFAAGFISLLAYRSFDRCLERMPDQMAISSRSERALRRRWRVERGV